MLHGRGLAKLEDLRIVQIGDQLLRLFAEFMIIFSLIQVLQERLLARVAFELLNQLFDFASCPAVRLQNGVCLVFCGSTLLHQVPWGSAMRLGGHKMFLRLVLVDLVVLANSLLSTTRGNLGDRYTLWFYSSFVFMQTRILNTNRRWCVVEDDCV